MLDWYSRFVVSWTLDLTLEIGFVLEAMRAALATATPVICNSDQGSHFTSPQYIDLFRDTSVHISMDGKGRALDNIFTERLWRTVKYEEVYLKDYASPREARTGLGDYLDFYNYRRLHQALDYQTPAQIYFKEGEQSTDKLTNFLSDEGVQFTLLIGFTCLENCQQVINNFGDRQCIPNKYHTGHWQILCDTIIGMFRHRIQIMGKQNTSFSSGPFQNCWIIGAR